MSGPQCDPDPYIDFDQPEAEDKHAVPVRVRVGKKGARRASCK